MGTICRACGLRVYLVQSPAGKLFYVTSSVPGQIGGLAECLPLKGFTKWK